ITISRAAHQEDFPAACQLVAAESLPVRLVRRSERPLPVHARSSHALSAQVVGAAARPHRYSVELPALSPAELSGRSASIGETSAIVARRVADARDRQLERQGKTNRELDGREVDA